MCEDMGWCRCVGTWEDTDVWGHGRMKVCDNMGGCRCVRAWDDADV